jgi:ATP-dependent DNA helicase RecG
MGILSARPEAPETAEDPLARILAPIESLPGLRKPDLLAHAVGGGRVLDLLLHVPERVQHRPVLRSLSGAVEGQEVTLELRITGAPARGGRGPWMVPAVCGADPVALISFSRATWAGTALTRAFPQGAERRVAGRLKAFQRAWQLELDADPLVEPPHRIPLWQPIWPLTAGLSWRNMADALDGALKALPDLPEWVDGPLLKRSADALAMMNCSRGKSRLAWCGGVCGKGRAAPFRAMKACAAPPWPPSAMRQRLPSFRPWRR